MPALYAICRPSATPFTRRRSDAMSRPQITRGTARGNELSSARHASTDNACGLEFNRVRVHTADPKARSSVSAPGAVLLQREPRDPQAPLPYREAMEQTEHGLYQEYVRDCADIRILRRLERRSIAPLERIQGLERRLRVLPSLFEQQRAIDGIEKPILRERARQELRTSSIEGPFPRFPPGYALGSEENELARARCELSEARWEFFVTQRGRRVPGRALAPRP